MCVILKQYLDGDGGILKSYCRRELHLDHKKAVAKINGPNIDP